MKPFSFPNGILADVLFSYKSTNFTTQFTIDYPAILVAQNFVSNGVFGPTAPAMPICCAQAISTSRNESAFLVCDIKNLVGLPPNVTQLEGFQQRQSSLIRLEHSECLKTFGATCESEYRLVIVTNAVRQRTAIHWLCVEPERRLMCKDTETSASGATCDVSKLISAASDWQLCNPNIRRGSRDPVNIEHCLAEPST